MKPLTATPDVFRVLSRTGVTRCRKMLLGRRGGIPSVLYKTQDPDEHRWGPQPKKWLKTLAH